MKYILTSVTSGGAATVCRQRQHETGYEMYRQLNNRYSIPVGTRSMAYLTKLLKPTLDPNNSGMLSPMTLTPTGVVPQAGAGNADYWYWNS